MIDDLDDEPFEAESFEGPIIVLNRRTQMAGTWHKASRKKSSNRVFDIPKPDRRPGISEALKASHGRIARFRNKPGFPDYRRSGTPDGMSKHEAQNEWKEARKIAFEIMEKMKEAGLMPDIPAVGTEIVREPKTDADRAEAAVLAALEIMNSPMNQELKLKAATLLLNFFKAKPSSKQEVTVKTAQEWFASLEDDSDTE